MAVTVVPLLDKAVFGLQIGKLSKWILDVVVYGNGFIWIDLRLHCLLSFGLRCRLGLGIYLRLCRRLSLG